MEFLAFILGFAAAALFVPPPLLDKIQRGVRRKVADLMKSKTNNHKNGGSR